MGYWTGRWEPRESRISLFSSSGVSRSATFPPCTPTSPKDVWLCRTKISAALHDPKPRFCNNLSPSSQLCQSLNHHPIISSPTIPKKIHQGCAYDPQAIKCQALLWLSGVGIELLYLSLPPCSCTITQEVRKRNMGPGELQE